MFATFCDPSLTREVQITDPDVGTQNAHIARLLKIYNDIKPLLSVVSTLPLIPSGGRARPVQQCSPPWPRRAICGEA